MNAASHILKRSLQQRLQTALQLELSTIPPYLTALYSIMPGANIQAANVIRSVLMEEMLHMVMAANTLSALGGKVRLGKRDIPSFPLSMDFHGKFKRKFDVSLQPLSKPAINTFLQIELPETAVGKVQQRGNFIVSGDSVGGFYQNIMDDLVALCCATKNSEVFSGNKQHQINAQYYWGAGGTAIEVTDLDSAIAAISLIVDQGEGAKAAENVLVFDQKETLPHYYRFLELRNGKYYNSGDNPLLPTGAPLAINFAKMYPLKHNPKHKDYMHLEVIRHENAIFNLNYAMMLSQLEEGFNGNQQAFYGAIVNCMKNMSVTAARIVQMPISSDVHAAPSFEWPSKFNLHA